MERRHVLSSIGALAACGLVAGRASALMRPIRQGFDLSVPFAPFAVRVGGTVRLGYELHLTSFAREKLMLVRVRAVDGRTGAILATLQGETLAAAIDRPAAAGGADHRALGRGERTIVYFDVALDSQNVPLSIRHEIDFESLGRSGREAASTSGGETVVSDRALPVLSPPLRGGPWVAVYEPGLRLGHRRYIYAIGGRARVPGRYAVDWMKPGLMESAPQPGSGGNGLGAEVLAIGDGVITATRDGVSEPRADASRPRTALADATGNYIALKLGEGRFAFYEHLLPGLLVKPGDRVRRGQVIAKVGSTGQAWRPHLHFHMADANSPLGAEGLPYLLTEIRTIGAYSSIEAFERGGPWVATADSPKPDRPYFPAPNAVVMFEGTG